MKSVNKQVRQDSVVDPLHNPVDNQLEEDVWFTMSFSLVRIRSQILRYFYEVC